MLQFWAYRIFTGYLFNIFLMTNVPEVIRNCVFRSESDSRVLKIIQEVAKEAHNNSHAMALLVNELFRP